MHRALASPDTSFMLGQQVLPGHFGAVSHALIHTPNLREALAILGRAHASIHLLQGILIQGECVGNDSLNHPEDYTAYGTGVATPSSTASIAACIPRSIVCAAANMLGESIGVHSMMQVA
jgi:hypothetical protein